MHTYLNSNTFSLPSLSTISFETDTPKRWVPMESKVLGPLTHQFLAHPYQATPVTLPGQQFLTCITGPKHFKIWNQQHSPTNQYTLSLPKYNLKDLKVTFLT